MKKIKEEKKPDPKELKKKEAEFIKIAEKVHALCAPNKCFVIIQDQKGNGISRATKDFSMFEFEQWVQTIRNSKKTDL